MKLELQQMIHIRLCKKEQQGRRFMACKANEVDHDHIQGKHCPNGLKLGTRVHHGMAHKGTLDVPKVVEENWMTLQFLLNLGFFCKVTTKHSLQNFDNQH